MRVPSSWRAEGGCRIGPSSTSPPILPVSVEGAVPDRPLVSVVGRKQYRGGQASMQLRVLALVPVANKAGGGLNQGDLLRYLGSDFKATLVRLLANKYGLEPMHFAMERKMLLGVKRRAEQAAAR
jgi:hypothetical protein